jgi:hypothetical protein
MSPTNPESLSSSISPLRPRSVNLLGILLMGQALGLTGLAYASLKIADNQEIQIHDIVTAAGFLSIAILALLSALGILGLRQRAWTMAVATQGINLAFALILYFRERPFYIYEVLLIGIFMVIYLHYTEIQALFRPVPTPHDKVQK